MQTGTAAEGRGVANGARGRGDASVVAAVAEGGAKQTAAAKGGAR